MATLSSILAWKTPWTEEPGGLQSMESQEPDTTERLKYQEFQASLLPGGPVRASGREAGGKVTSVSPTVCWTLHCPPSATPHYRDKERASEKRTRAQSHTRRHL